MRRLSMSLKCVFIGVDFDEEEQGWIFRLLVNVEYMTAMLAFETRTSVPKKTLAEGLDSVLTDLEVSGVQECHVIST